MENAKQKAKEIKKEVLKNCSYKFSTGDTSQYALNVIAYILKDGKYIAKQNGDKYEWEITQNPFYKPEIKHMLINAIISSAVALLFGYIQYQCQRQQDTQKIKQLQNQMDTVQSKLDSLNTRQK
jgi:outer membrane murein-binding lipoprotein Lpp